VCLDKSINRNLLFGAGKRCGRGLLLGLPEWFVVRSSNMKQVGLAVAATMGIGTAVHIYLQYNLESRTEQLRLLKRHDEQLFGKASSNDQQGPNKRAVEDMLLGLKSKTTTEKIRAAVDAAHMTHDIGFPSKNGPSSAACKEGK